MKSGSSDFTTVHEKLKHILRKYEKGDFTTVDEPLFKELAALTGRGYERFKELKYIA